MKVLVPVVTARLALRRELADQGRDVLIVDNLGRRKIDIDLEVESLTRSSAGERLDLGEIGGKPMRFVHMDVAQYQRLLDLLLEEKPDSVVRSMSSKNHLSMKRRHQALHRR